MFNDKKIEALQKQLDNINRFSLALLKELNLEVEDRKEVKTNWNGEDEVIKNYYFTKINNKKNGTKIKRK